MHFFNNKLFAGVIFFVSVWSCTPQSAERDAGLGPGSDAAVAQRYSKTYTEAQDFTEGVLNGLSSDSEGQLQMNVGQTEFATPYLWVPNSAENTITLIDTTDMSTIGTYPLIDDDGETCSNPSRTTVDFNWDVWVGCRGEESYCNRGECPNEMDPEKVDNKVMKVSFRDGHVMLSVHVGNGPRALALDANNNLWVGCSVDDTVWEIDAETGACLRGEGCAQPAIAVPDFPYGSVVDQKGVLWTNHNEIPTESPCEVSRIDTTSGQVLGVYGPYIRNGCDDLYGITVDQLGDVWLGGFHCDDVVKISGQSGFEGSLIGTYLVGGEDTRGVAVDLDGNLWAASSSTNTVTKLNGATGALLNTVQVGTSPIGVAVDSYGHVWVVNQGANSVTKINGIDMTTQEIDVGRGPYTYSDMLGLSLRTITLRNQSIATWRAQIDSGSSTSHFTELRWSVDVPPSTEFSVRYRCAKNQQGLDTAAFSLPMAEPGPVDCGELPLEWLEVEARFMA